MAGETIVTIVGNLTADPDLRFTSSGAAVANFTVASTSRVFDRQSGEWKDGEALLVTGRLKQRSYDTKEGEKRTVIELDVDEIGPSLRYATAKVNKASRNGATTPSPAGDEQPMGDKPPF
jgi:single-strand DNA-binding protein